MLIYSTIDLHQGTTNLKFGSCIALWSSSPVTEASKLITYPCRGRESVSDSISAIEAPASMCYMYIDNQHAPLELCSYWGCGQVFIYYKIEGGNSCSCLVIVNSCTYSKSKHRDVVNMIIPNSLVYFNVNNSSNDNRIILP